jgi:23S rRNA-/tRNA-specific pseudouridylate synthase
MNKPEGFASQVGVKASYGVDSIAKAYFAEARLTHRLDRETSGVLVLAKNKLTARKLTTMFADRTVEKTYKAVVRHGIDNEGVIQTDIEKDPQGQKMFVTKGNSCITHYKKVQENKNFALVDVFPKTGKMHQIRVHLASVGFPILGDFKYDKQKTEAPRMFLHAFEISIDGRKFQAPLPNVFSEVLGLRNPENLDLTQSGEERL